MRREMVDAASLDVDTGDLGPEVRRKDPKLDCTTPCNRIQDFRCVLRWRQPEGLTKWDQSDQAEKDVP